MPPFLTKRKVGERYGWKSLRNVERAAADGRLPPPDFPVGPKAPRWDLAKLEERERAAVARSRLPNEQENGPALKAGP